jgi:hypothetical protein
MKRTSNNTIKFIFSSFLAVFLSFSHLSFAQTNNSNQSFLIRPWAIGQTATYQTKVFKNGNLSGAFTTTYSIVGQETVKGKNYFWLELETLTSNGNHNILKLQVRAFKAIDFENSVLNFPRISMKRRELLLAGGHLSEVKISSDVVSQVENSPDPSETKDESGKFTVSPEETVNVQAGIFNASKFRISPSSQVLGKTPIASSTSDTESRFTDTWGSSNIPILGVIKSTSQGIDINGQPYISQKELLSYSETGAVSKIIDMPTDPWLSPTETPTVVSPPIPKAPSKRSKTNL